MGVAYVGVTNTFYDDKATDANYSRLPKLFMVTAILPSQKIKKNANMFFGDHFVTVAKKQKAKKKKET